MLFSVFLVWRVPRTLSFRMVFSYLVTTGWIFGIKYVRIQSDLSNQHCIGFEQAEIY